MTAVENQIAGHLLYTIGAQVTHQQPELFHIQLGIAAALEVQVAAQHAVAQGAVGEEFGFPLVGRAEHFKGRVGGNQLHGRRRIDRYVGVEHGRCTWAVERQHHQRECVIAEFAGFQGLLNLGGQRGVDDGSVGG